MKKYNKIIVLCLAALILIQGTGLVVNFQEKRILAEKLEAYEEKVSSYEEKLDKVDTLLSETGDLLENVNTVMENVGTVISKLSLFK